MNGLISSKFYPEFGTRYCTVDTGLSFSHKPFPDLGAIIDYKSSLNLAWYQSRLRQD